MKRNLFFTGFFFLALLSQVLATYLPASFLKIDLPLLFVCYAGFHLSFAKGGTTALAIGFVTESLASTVPGVVPFSYLVVFFLIQLAREGFYVEGNWIRALLVGGVSFFQKGFESLLVGGDGVAASPLYWGFFGALEGLASILFFLTLERITRKVFGEGIRDA